MQDWRTPQPLSRQARRARERPCESKKGLARSGLGPAGHVTSHVAEAASSPN